MKMEILLDSLLDFFSSILNFSITNNATSNSFGYIISNFSAFFLMDAQERKMRKKVRRESKNKVV